MLHQNGRRKLNRKPAHKRSMIRNQAMLLVKHGYLQSTKPRIKEVQSFIEKIVTIARVNSGFNTIRRINQLLPYDEVVVRKMIEEIAPKYKDRSGGYTRIIPLGRRGSDTAPISRIEWV